VECGPPKLQSRVVTLRYSPCGDTPTAATVGTVGLTTGGVSLLVCRKYSLFLYPYSSCLIASGWNPDAQHWSKCRRCGVHAVVRGPEDSTHAGSVGDPDPHVFGLPGSGSIRGTDPAPDPSLFL
jgi:hypothetical protein